MTSNSAARGKVPPILKSQIGVDLDHVAVRIAHELERDSESFRMHWCRRDVRRPAPQSKVLNHRLAGRLDLDYATFQADSDREVRFTIYTPTTPESAEKLAALAARPPRGSRTARSSIAARL